MKVLVLGILGVGVMLSASALNLTINSLLGFYFSFKDKTFDMPIMLVMQAVLASSLAVMALRLAHYYYINSALPPM